MPWLLTNQVFQLVEEEGVDRLIARYDKKFVDFDKQQAIHDIDTPEKYRRALAAADSKE